MESNKRYLDYEGLSLYDRILKEYLDRRFAHNYAEESDIVSIVNEDSDYDEEGIVQVKTLGLYYRLLKKNIDFVVKESKPMVKIDGEFKELATTEYVDEKFMWKESL